MKKIILSILVVAVLGNTLPVSPITAMALSSANRIETSSDTDYSVLDKAYSMLNQFIVEQKDNGNHAFYLANVYECSYFADNNGQIPAEFQNKVVLEYFWENKESVLTAVKAFMQENGIDENLVAYASLVDADESDQDKVASDQSLKNAFTLLEQFVSEQKDNGNHAFYLANVYECSYFADNNGQIPAEFQNKVVLEYFWENKESVLTAVKAFMQENGIDENLVAYASLVDADESDQDKVASDQSLKNAFTLLEQFVSEQKDNGNHAFYLANVYECSYFADNNGQIPAEFQNKVVLEYFWENKESVLTAVKAFMQENGIDENLVAYAPLVDADESDQDTVASDQSLKNAFTLLEQFVSEQKDNGNLAFRLANVFSQEDLTDEEGNIPDAFKDKVVVEYYYSDKEEFLKAVNEFMKNNNIDESLVFFTELQDGVPDIKFGFEHEGDGDTFAEEANVGAEIGFTIIGLKDGESVTYSLSDEEVAKIASSDNKRVTVSCLKDGKTVLTAKSSDGQSFDVEITVKPVATDPVPSDASQLPQTGYSDIYKVIACLAALMTVSGAVLVVKTRKENE